MASALLYGGVWTFGMSWSALGNEGIGRKTAFVCLTAVRGWPEWPNGVRLGGALRESTPFGWDGSGSSQAGAAWLLPCVD